MSGVSGSGLYGAPTVGQISQMLSPGVRAGVTIGPDLRAASVANTAISANVMYAHPLQIPAACNLASMVLSIGTAVVGVSGKMALYSAGPDGMIGTLIEESADILDMNGTANTIPAAAFAATRAAGPSVVWLACKFDGAAQPHTLTPGDIMGAGGVFMYGALSLAAFVRSIGSTETYYRASVASTYADPFPAAPTLTFSASSPGVPIMGLITA